VGSTVHAVLERLAASALDQGLERCQWPARARLGELALEAARAVLERERSRHVNLAPALAERALYYLERAQERDQQEAGVLVRGEAQGSARFSLAPDHSLAVAFRADRVERQGAVEVWIDFKTGRPSATAGTAERRTEQLLLELARGERLQAALYALAGAPGEPREGAYVHLTPDAGAARTSSLRADDARLGPTWLRTLAVLERAQRHGTYFPRLFDPGKDREPDACARCEVALACSRGDSAARARFIESLAELCADASPAERAAQDLWRLPNALPEGACPRSSAGQEPR
jgi:hypothetical protein